MEESPHYACTTPTTITTSEPTTLTSHLQLKRYKEIPTQEWVAMVGSEASGVPLVKQGQFAADMLHFRPYQKTSLHVHPGDHILFVVSGDGWLIFDGDRYELVPGTCYLVPGAIPHQVIASDTEMYLLSVANNHKTVDSPERLEVIVDAPK